MGGRGGKKTYQTSLGIAYNVTIKGKRIQLLRDEDVRSKNSILAEVLQRYDTANVGGVLNGMYTRTENSIKNKEGTEVLFTQGFRASSNEKSANLKGVANVDIGVVEEAADIRDEFKFNHWRSSIRGEGSFIILILNTPDINHWIIRRYFTLVPLSIDDYPQFEAKDLEGYYKVLPKDVKGVYTIQTTFRDNEFLPDNIREEYEAYGDPTHNSFDLHYFLTEIEGHANTGVKGQYIKKYSIISEAEYQNLDYQEVYGLDFGTTSPAGMVAIKAYKNDIYIKELNYEPLNLRSLAFKLAQLGLNEKSLIVADSAEPHTIRSLRYGIRALMTTDEIERYPMAANGFNNIRPAPEKSILGGLNKLLSYNIHIVEGSDNLVHELSMYAEARDRNGIGMKVPIDAFNHVIDPIRYVVQVHGKWY
jgi:PBSX family phage terminase large subunit